MEQNNGRGWNWTRYIFILIVVTAVVILVPNVATLLTDRSSGDEEPVVEAEAEAETEAETEDESSSGNRMTVTVIIIIGVIVIAFSIFQSTFLYYREKRKADRGEANKLDEYMDQSSVGSKNKEVTSGGKIANTSMGSKKSGSSGSGFDYRHGNFKNIGKK